MIEFTALPPAGQAIALVGIVLIEAVVLYLGYGLLETRLAPPVLDAIEGK